MNRRSFIRTLLAGAIAPAFLPGAGRKWVRTETLYVPLSNPAYLNAPFEVIFLCYNVELLQQAKANFAPPS